ncbi:MAG: hypothetical protein K8T25_15035, partial [Planctomycetia bacterium]|nr:hypothetical protein [Planctomycetia bacterium]
DVDRTHPICERTFAGQHTGHELAGMLVDRYFAVDKQWRPDPASNTRVVAWLRNKAPLIVEHSFGRGTCLAVLTTAAPRWNNWATRPTGVLMWLETQVYLVARQAPRTCIEVGQPLTVEFDKSQYSPEVQFVRPTAKAPLRETVQATPIAAQPDRLSATLTATPLAGIYEARLKRTDGTMEVLRYAVNVPTSEGNLRTVSAEELLTITAGSPITVHGASEFSGDVTQQAGVNLGSHWGFFVILLGLLIVEQVLAYSASYHLPVQKGLVAKGRAVQTGGVR